MNTNFLTFFCFVYLSHKGIGCWAIKAYWVFGRKGIFFSGHKATELCLYHSFIIKTFTSPAINQQIRSTLTYSARSAPCVLKERLCGCNVCSISFQTWLNYISANHISANYIFNKFIFRHTLNNVYPSFVGDAGPVTYYNTRKL